MSRMTAPGAGSTPLIENTKLADRDCPWCSARAGLDVHSRACPIGERSQQIQRLGGVPWPNGKPLLSRSDFHRTRDYRAYLRRQEPGFAERAKAARQRTQDERLKAFIADFYAERQWLLENGL